jgi:hypothetical protein
MSQPSTQQSASQILTQLDVSLFKNKKFKLIEDNEKNQKFIKKNKIQTFDFPIENIIDCDEEIVIKSENNFLNFLSIKKEIKIQEVVLTDKNNENNLTENEKNIDNGEKDKNGNKDELKELENKDDNGEKDKNGNKEKLTQNSNKEQKKNYSIRTIPKFKKKNFNKKNSDELDFLDTKNDQ